ncbi:uncharacterized protein LOC132615540 [Lycium barbarum]|uniref:uncharacterized protein LOC132615540 n=1 Tax=Lycium barbarum TaxID=112863 RepID=UPI00293F4C72|nr:uncharacterized protein LOC132615540 [Lycium barbarum]XP_060186126.1 uncharacterized protein LOC132615540 [Lycium barbarum]
MISALSEGSWTRVGAHTLEQVAACFRTSGVQPAADVAPQALRALVVGVPTPGINLWGIVARPRVPPTMTVDEQKKWDKFDKMKPQTYDRHLDADAYEFLVSFHERLDTLGPVESNGVGFVEMQIIGPTKQWWRVFLETRLVGSPPLTSEDFSIVLLEKWVPFSLLEGRRERFDHFEQVSMSVTQYEMEIYALSCHALTILPDEAERIHKFIRGLSYHLKVVAMFIASSSKDFQGVVDAVRGMDTLRY